MADPFDDLIAGASRKPEGHASDPFDDLIASVPSKPPPGFEAMDKLQGPKPNTGLGKDGVLQIARKGGTSATEAAGEHFIKGALGGWSDELAGFAEKFDISRKAGSSGGTQTSESAGKAATKQVRERLEELHQAHPVASTIGEIAGVAAGSAVPLGTASKGAQVARAAAEGGLAGAGYSDADTLAGRLAGAAVGAGLGAGAAIAVPAAVNAATRGAKAVYNKAVETIKPLAEKRLRGRAIGELTAGATPTQKAAVLADEEGLLREAKDLGVPGSKPKEFAEAAKAAEETSKKAASELRGTITTRAGDADVNNVVGAVKVARDRAAQNPAMASKVKQMDSFLEDVEKRYAKAKPPEPLGDQEVLQLVANKAPASVKQKLGVRPDKVVANVKKFGIDKAAEEGAEQFASTTSGALQTTGKRIGEITDELQGFTEGVDVKAFSKAMNNVRKEIAKNPARKGEAEAVFNLMRNSWETWGGMNAKVPLKDFRKFVTDLQGAGFAGQVLDPSAQKIVKRQVAAAAKGVLDDHIDDLATKQPQLKKLVDELREHNDTYSVLKDVDKAAQKRLSVARITPEPPRALPEPGGPGVVSQQQLDEMVGALPESHPARAPLAEMADQRFTAAAGEDLGKLKTIEQQAQRRQTLREIGEHRQVSALGDERRPASAGGIVEEMTGVKGSLLTGLVNPALGKGVFLAGLAKKFGPQIVDAMSERLVRLKSLADRGVAPDTLLGIATKLGISREIATQAIGMPGRLEAAAAGAH